MCSFFSMDTGRLYWTENTGLKKARVSGDWTYHKGKVQAKKMSTAVQDFMLMSGEAYGFPS
jgi:hypothetical protein